MMGAAEVRARRGELMQQHTDKWQRSTKDMWKRSATMWFDFEDKCHQTTIEVWHKSADSWSTSKEKAHQSTTKAWHRSTNSWNSSMNKAQKSSTKAWNQSTNTWNTSVNKYRHSTAGFLNRSAENLSRSAENLNKAANKKVVAPSPLSDWMAPSEEHSPVITQQEQSSQPSEPSSPSMSSPSPYEPLKQYRRPRSISSPISPESERSAQRNQNARSPTSPVSTESPKNTSLPRTASLPQSISGTTESSSSSTTADVDLTSKKRKAAAKQARALIELTSDISDELKEAQLLCDLKRDQLGEIELDWIRTTITDADSANQDLARLVEPLKADITNNKGKTTHANRKRWRRQDCDRARGMYDHVIAKRENLKGAIHHLSEVKPRPLVISTPVEEPKETAATPVAELPVEDEEVIQSLPAITELPSDPIYIPLELAEGFAELPGDSAPAPSELPGDLPLVDSALPDSPTHANSAPQLSIPRIIVTHNADDLLDQEMRSPDIDFSDHTTSEMHDDLAWKQARNEYRDQQSASFTKIISKMETKRFYKK